jgi:hypothetical protein
MFHAISTLQLLSQACGHSIDFLKGIAFVFIGIERLIAEIVLIELTERLRAVYKPLLRGAPLTSTSWSSQGAFSEVTIPTTSCRFIVLVAHPLPYYCQDY